MGKTCNRRGIRKDRGKKKGYKRWENSDFERRRAFQRRRRKEENEGHLL